MEDTYNVAKTGQMLGCQYSPDPIRWEKPERLGNLQKRGNLVDPLSLHSACWTLLVSQHRQVPYVYYAEFRPNMMGEAEDAWNFANTGHIWCIHSVSNSTWLGLRRRRGAGGPG